MKRACFSAIVAAGGGSICGGGGLGFRRREGRHALQVSNSGFDRRSHMLGAVSSTPQSHLQRLVDCLLRPEPRGSPARMTTSPPRRVPGAIGFERGEPGARHLPCLHEVSDPERSSVFIIVFVLPHKHLTMEVPFARLPYRHGVPGLMTVKFPNFVPGSINLNFIHSTQRLSF